MSCGCRLGLPPVCEEGKRLLAREARAMEQRVRLMHRGLDDYEYKAAKERLQVCRDDLRRHLTVESETYESQEREGMKA